MWLTKKDSLTKGLFVLFVVAVLCMFMWYLWHQEHNDDVSMVDDPRVLAAQQGFNAYYDRMTICDLAAREATSKDAARSAYLSAVVRDGARLASYAARVRDAMGQQQQALKVAVLDDRERPRAVESGWPHTHGDVVCMPASYLERADLPRLARTLAHEATHVCQRSGSCPAPGTGAGVPRMSEAEFGARFPDLEARRRSNPDLDGYLYGDGSGSVVVSLFESREAAAAGGLGAAKVHLVDVSTGEAVAAPAGTHEHPNEAHAYAAELAI